MESQTDVAEARANEELITIAGGVELEITYADGNKETVRVRQIPISRLNNFISTMGDEAEAIALYCDKPREWGDTLTLESASAILDKGQEINLPFLVAWFRRQAKWRKGSASVIAGPGIESEKPIASPLGSSVPQSPTTIT